MLKLNGSQVLFLPKPSVIETGPNCDQVWKPEWSFPFPAFLLSSPREPGPSVSGTLRPSTWHTL